MPYIHKHIKYAIMILYQEGGIVVRALIKYFERSDKFLLMFFNNWIKCKFFDIFMPAVTYLGSTIFTSFFCLAALISKNSTIHLLGIECFITLVISNAIAHIIKISVSRLRPFLIFDNLHIKKIGIDKYSFPSGHTTAAFSIAVMISLFFPQLTVLCIALAFCTGISRMYLGVHYPSDVIVGIFLGSSCSIAIFYLIPL